VAPGAGCTDEENLAPNGIRSWTFQPAASRYTNQHLMDLQR